MKSGSATLTVKVNFKFDDAITVDEAMKDIVLDMDYLVAYDSDHIAITDTEIIDWEK